MAMSPSGSAVVGPLTQTSTTAYVPVAGSLIDLTQTAEGKACYVVQETGGVNGINVKIQASMDQVTWFDVLVNSQSTAGAGYSLTVMNLGAGTAVSFNCALSPAALGTVSSYVPTPWPGRYLQVVIQDLALGSHGNALVNGFAH